MRVAAWITWGLYELVSRAAELGPTSIPDSFLARTEVSRSSFPISTRHSAHNDVRLESRRHYVSQLVLPIDGPDCGGPEYTATSRERQDQLTGLDLGRSYNRYLAVAARVVRRSLKEDKRLAAERRGEMELRFAKWTVSWAGLAV